VSFKEIKKKLFKNIFLDKENSKILETITTIQNANKSSASSGLNILEEFRKKEFYKPLLIMSAFFGIQQFSGIFTLFVLAAKFSMEAGIKMDAFLCAVILGALRVIFTFIVSFAINKFKRRQLAILSSSGMLFSMVGLVIYQTLSLSDSAMSWLPVIFLLIFCLFGVLGILTLPFVMVTEVFQQKARGLGIGLATSFCFFISFITIKTFALFFDIIGSEIMFSFYGFVSLVGIFFSIYILPETSGKTVLDMEIYFQK
jgi:MFS family permease